LTAPLVAQKYPTTNVYELDVGDDLTSGELGLRSLWNACNQPDQRGYDTLDYLTGVMEMFYANTTHHLKSTLGYKGLVHGSKYVELLALHYITLHSTLHYTTLHYTTLHYTTLHYTTLHYTTLHNTTQHTN